MPHHIAHMKIELFRSLTLEKQGFFLLEMQRKTRQRILADLTIDEIVDILPFLDPGQATDILQDIPDDIKRDGVINSLNTEVKEKISFLFGFAPNSAAGMMDVDYIQVPSDTTFAEVKKRVTRYEQRTGKIPSILIIDNARFEGELPHKALLTHTGGNTKKITSYIRTLPSIHYTQSSEKVLEKLHNHPHKRMVVLDDHQCVIGVIYSDDIIRLLQRQSASRLYDFAGVRDEEDIFDSIGAKVKSRYKWLMVNLFTAYMAAGVVSLFSDTLSKFVLLAVYMPIVAGMGGNAATQTLAVTVRGIALGEISLKNSFVALRNEVGAGFVNGCINGVIVAIIAVLWNHSPMLGVITGAAMVINLVIAGFFGAMIPLVMKKLHKDPATSATIFITTATDVFGFFTFLGLATLFL